MEICILALLLKEILKSCPFIMIILHIKNKYKNNLTAKNTQLQKLLEIIKLKLSINNRFKICKNGMFIELDN